MSTTTKKEQKHIFENRVVGHYCLPLFLKNGVCCAIIIITTFCCKYHTITILSPSHTQISLYIYLAVFAPNTHNPPLSSQLLFALPPLMMDMDFWGVGQTKTPICPRQKRFGRFEKLKEDEEKIETNTHACVYVVDDVSLLHSCGNLQE